LTSPGRSTTIDFPTPSGTKFAPNSEAATAAAGDGERGAAEAKSRTTKSIGRHAVAIAAHRVHLAIGDSLRVTSDAAIPRAAGALPSTISRATFMTSTPCEATVEPRPGGIPPVKRQPMVNIAYQNLVN